MKKLLLSISLTIFSLISYAQISGYITFETPDSLVQIDTSLVGNIWQIGTPLKTFFDSAYSAPNAIATDTINFYPPNNFSAFTIKISDPAWNPGQPFNRTYIEFRHKYDTDSLQDGGYIEISYDGGSTWTNVVNDLYITGFYYDGAVIANGNAAYTGRSSGFSNGWTQGNFGWCYNPNWTTPVYLRFVFSSDSIQTNKDGWMIDEILLMSDICEGIEEIQNDNLISISPNPASNELRIHKTKVSNNQTIKILNYTGQSIYDNKHFKEETIDTRQLLNGIYLLKYSDSKNFCVKRFVVQH